MGNPVVLHARVVTGRGGGPEKTILNSPRYLRDEGFDSLCLYMHPPDDGSGESLSKRAAAAQAPLLSVPDRGAFDLSVIGKLISICRQHDVAIWHAHDYKSNALGLILRRWWPMRLVTTVHGWVSLKGRMPFYTRVDKWCLRRFDRIICVSDDLHEEVSNLGISDAKCDVIYNSIETHEYVRMRTVVEAKARLGIPPESFVVGAAGRLEAEKGFEYLVRAVRQCAPRHDGLRLYLAGDGELRGELSTLVEELGIRDRVCLMGHVSDMRSFYEAMDLFVLSSLREAFPNVLLEAMAYEVPVVATRVAGTPVLIRPGQTGVLVNAANADALSTAIDQAIDSPDRASWGLAGRRLIEGEFCFRRRMRRVADIYRDVLSR